MPQLSEAGGVGMDVAVNLPRAAVKWPSFGCFRKGTQRTGARGLGGWVNQQAGLDPVVPQVVQSQARAPRVRRRGPAGAWRAVDGVSGFRRTAGVGRGRRRIQ
jgi:hypothetical protein